MIQLIWLRVPAQPGYYLPEQLERKTASMLMKWVDTVLWWCAVCYWTDLRVVKRDNSRLGSSHAGISSAAFR